MFNQIKPFLDSAYSISILKGIVTSSGGLTESTLKASQQTLFEYLSQMSDIKDEAGNIDKEAQIKKKKEFIKKLCTLYETNLKVDRVTQPLIVSSSFNLADSYSICSLKIIVPSRCGGKAHLIFMCLFLSTICSSVIALSFSYFYFVKFFEAILFQNGLKTNLLLLFYYYYY